MKHHTCNAVLCRAAILSRELFCERHLALVESDVLRILQSSYRPSARQQSDVFNVTMERAREEILNVQTQGRRARAVAEWEW